MTRTSLEIKLTVAASQASGPKLESASNAGPLLNLYSAFFHLQVADKGRFVDRKSYHNRRWWDENYKLALLAIDETLIVVVEDDSALQRLLVYIHCYCLAVALMLVSQRNGHCQLCDEYTTLAASHIVPHFFFAKCQSQCFFTIETCVLCKMMSRNMLCAV